MARKVITIFGGSGMLGRLIARRYARKGYEVRVAVRRPNQALFVRTFGEVGQVNPIQANLRDHDSMRRVVRGADIVVNSVGILYETHKERFDAVQAEGAGELARISKEEGVAKFVQISAIGADENAPSRSAKSKADGERRVLEAYRDALVVRPSAMFGAETDIFNRFGKMARWSWVMPVIEAKSKFQPVYADDVAEFVEQSLDEGRTGVFELGGGEIMTMREIIEFVCQETRRNRMMINMPSILALVMAWSFQILQLLTFGLFRNHILTPDQLKQLGEDNIVEGEGGLRAARIVPETHEHIMEPYMECYRPRGEFDDLVKAGL